MSSYCTLIWLTSDRMVRADFNGGDRPAELRQGQRPPVDSLPLAVEAALRLGGAPAGPVWVLATDLWMQTLDIDPATLSALPAEEIARALSFEAESLSGLSGGDSALGHATALNSNGRREYWVVQQPIWQREEIEGVVARAGGRLAGVCHPGGLPAPLPGVSAESIARGDWQRIELWPDAVVCIAGGSAGAGVRLEVIPSDPRLNAWADAASRWSEQVGRAGDSETLSWSGAFSSSSVSGYRFSSLEDSERLSAWLTAWASQLSTDPSRVPHLRPPVRPMSPEVRWAIALALGVVAAVACWFHMTGITSETESLRAKTTEVDKAVKQKTALETKKKELEKNRDAVQKEVDTLRADVTLVRAAYAAQRERWSKLLALIARKKPTDLLVRGVEAKANEVLIKGVCLHPEQPVELASILAESVAPWGWQVHMPQQTAGTVREDGAPFEFTLKLVEVTPTSADAPAANVAQMPPSGD